MKDKNNLEPSDYKTSVSGSLNGLEALEEIVDYAINEFTDNEKKYQKDLETIEKELRALDIIKNKIVLVDVFIESEDVNDYNEFVSKSKDRHLTQEEYDLLKEVLKDGK